MPDNVILDNNTPAPNPDDTSGSTPDPIPVANVTPDPQIDPIPVVNVTPDPPIETIPVVSMTPDSVESDVNTSTVNAPAYLKFSGGLILFDYVMRMDHSLNVVATSHPVMKGAEISDHAFREPTEVTIEIAYNDTVIGSEEGHSYKAFEVLYNLLEARELLTLVTRLKTYSNMIITSISVPDDHTTIKALKATVILKEVKIVTVQTVEIQKQVTSSAIVESGPSSNDSVSYDSGSSSKAKSTSKTGTKATKKVDGDDWLTSAPTKEMLAKDPLGKLTITPKATPTTQIKAATVTAKNFNSFIPAVVSTKGISTKGTVKA